MGSGGEAAKERGTEDELSVLWTRLVCLKRLMQCLATGWDTLSMDLGAAPTDSDDCP